MEKLKGFFGVYSLDLRSNKHRPGVFTFSALFFVDASRPET